MIRMSSIITRIGKHKDAAKELAKEDLSKYFIFDALAMECFQAVNSAIDLGELLVSEKKLGFPAKYREIFEMLLEAKMISRNTLEKIKRLISHENEVFGVAKNLKDFCAS